MLTAVSSCLNSGLYTASRMAFSLSSRGDAPKAWIADQARRAGRRHHCLLGRGLPRRRSATTSLPDKVFRFLLNTSGAIALFVWLVIAGSQLILRRRMGAAAKDL